MTRFLTKYIIFSLLLLLILSACDDSLSIQDLDNIVIPSKDVSYNEYIQPVLNVKCGTSGCHDDGTRAGDYSVSNWANVVYPGIVDPGNVETSRLVWRIEGLGVPVMPPIGSIVRPLTKNQVDGIKTWIREGAKNN
ncbi:MAG: hypothetical protein L3J41_14595 [Melioribacteraceae bacterium]|nr:hypothetical protein [Melioribacteraceae bacterium]